MREGLGMRCEYEPVAPLAGQLTERPDAHARAPVRNQGGQDLAT